MESDTPRQMMLNADAAVAQGRFASQVHVAKAPDHFVLTFITEDPMNADGGEQVGYLLSRIYMTPEHLRRLAAVLDGQVALLDAEATGS